MSVFTHGAKLSAVTNCPGAKLSAVPNCPFLHMVPNCPRCQIVLVPNCTPPPPPHHIITTKNGNPHNGVDAGFAVWSSELSPNSGQIYHRHHQYDVWLQCAGRAMRNPHRFLSINSRACKHSVWRTVHKCHDGREEVAVFYRFRFLFILQLCKSWFDWEIQLSVCSE